MSPDYANLLHGEPARPTKAKNSIVSPDKAMPLRAIVLLPLVMMVGCVTQPVESSHLPHQPGQKGLLTYREEMHSGESTEFGGLEMPFEITQGKDGTIQLAFSIRRFYTGNTYKGATEMHDSDNPRSGGRTADAQVDAEFARDAAAVKTLRFSATVDAGGRLIAFTGKGEPYEALKEVPASQKDNAEVAVAGVYKTIIEESLAYLPMGRSVRAGTQWRVHRPLVWPLHQFGIGMLTGCAAVSEDATCRVESVRATLGGQVATIRIRGERRAVGGYESVGAPTGNWLKVEGRVKFNLDTGELVSHRIVSQVRIVDPENPWKGEFIDTMAIKRR